MQQQQQQAQQQQQQHSTITTNMALAAEREAYLRLANHSMENSRQIAPHFNVRSPKAYGGYAVSIVEQLNIFFFFMKGLDRSNERHREKERNVDSCYLFLSIVYLHFSFFSYSFVRMPTISRSVIVRLEDD